LIDASNRGTGGQRKTLPAFFALVSIAAIVLLIFMDAPHRSDPEPATTLPELAEAAASELPANEALSEPRTSEQRVLEIERALVSNNPQQREMAFNVLLPELLESEPVRVVELVARQEGETRDALRDEVVRLWIRKDRDAAREWMGSIENESERKAAATIAMRTLAAIEPAQAIAVADEFGVGRDDGSLEHIVQIWAAEDFDGCMKWLETQPDNAHTAQLRARINGS
jgi:hypothetical protein